MRKKTDLFKLIQLTRSQVLYGYFFSGVHLHEVSNLAEHHYLVTFIAWQLALIAKKAGGKVNVQRTIELSMVHDLAELFGGDIALPYARMNPKAREYAKLFQKENNIFIAKFFGEQQSYYEELSHELDDKNTDESLIAKLADYIEMAHYKQFIKSDIKDYVVKIVKGSDAIFERMKDPITKRVLHKFLVDWSEEINTGDIDKVYSTLKEAKKYKTV